MIDLGDPRVRFRLASAYVRIVQRAGGWQAWTMHCLALGLRDTTLARDVAIEAMLEVHLAHGGIHPAMFEHERTEAGTRRPRPADLDRRINGRGWVPAGSNVYERPIHCDLRPRWARGMAVHTPDATTSAAHTRRTRKDSP